MPDELPPQSPIGSTPTHVTPTPLQPSSTGLAPNVAAGLAAVFTLLGGIIFILLEKRDQFVRFWAMQSIFFGGSWFAFSIISAILGTILGKILGLLAILWGLFSLLVNLAFLAIWVITLIQSFSGKEWEIPVLGKLARQQLAKSPV
jgi:uncharacterized membrane protein